MRHLSLALTIMTLPAVAIAETTLIDVSALPSKEVYEAADLTVLAVTADGSPAVIFLDLEAGEVVPPHATESGLRLLTVISGDLSWGDGDIVDEAQETVYPPGSVLTVLHNESHWLAARNGALRVQLIEVDEELVGPGIQEQMR